MKLTYLAQIGILDDWAHTVQIMKMCEAFSQNGVEVQLIVPKRKNSRNLDPFEYNGVSNNFKIKKLFYIDIFQENPSPVFYWLRFVTFLISARLYLIFTDYDVLYTREIYTGLFFRNVFIELHSLPKKLNGFKKVVLEKIAGIVVITSFIKSKLVDLGIHAEKILIAPDAVRLEDFADLLDKNVARIKLSLSQKDYLIGYIGTLKTMGMEKGVSTAIDALKFLPEKYKLYVVGGEKAHIDYYKNLATEHKVINRVTFVGTVLHKDIPVHISACDVLIAPFPKNDHYSYYMSPLKIFEYMAGKRPIIASNLPTLAEILKDGETALLVPPNDPGALGESILHLESNPVFSTKLAKNAYIEVVDKYTWKKRASNIIDLLSHY